MMRATLQKNIVTEDSTDAPNSEASLLKQQLMREITCLERQLERVRSREEFAEQTTLQTYEDMIASRRKMLDNLPFAQ